FLHIHFSAIRISCYRLCMNQQIPFMERLKLAWQVLVDSLFASRVVAGLDALEEKAAAAALPPERQHASGLMLVAALQREGRLVDFLQQDIAAFSDEDVGSAARVVHTGCRKVLKQFFQFEPAMHGTEGMPMTVPGGFDAQRIRLTGNVGGNAP